jgi:cephalosporin hydroxylase
MRTLREVYNDTRLGTKYGDKGTVHSYIEVYEKYIEPKRVNCNILELGVGYGESLIMWEDYIEKGLVVGVQHSINNHLGDVIDKYDLNVINMSATSNQLSSVLSTYKFDFIIDDASHKLIDQIESFKNLSWLVKPGGYYFIEDIEDIDKARVQFEALHDNCTIHDMRKEKDRFDNVIVAYKF